jgi:hypothetical protein
VGERSNQRKVGGRRNAALIFRTALHPRLPQEALIRLSSMAQCRLVEMRTSSVRLYKIFGLSNEQLLLVIGARSGTGQRERRERGRERERELPRILKTIGKYYKHMLMHVIEFRKKEKNTKYNCLEQ